MFKISCKGIVDACGHGTDYYLRDIWVFRSILYIYIYRIFAVIDAVIISLSTGTKRESGYVENAFRDFRVLN